MTAPRSNLPPGADFSSAAFTLAASAFTNRLYALGPRGVDVGLVLHAFALLSSVGDFGGRPRGFDSFGLDSLGDFGGSHSPVSW
jgi:hypothetical protein